MSTEMERVDCPFSEHGADLINVKFFRGTRDDVITSAEIMEQSRSAAMQVKLRTATISDRAPTSMHSVINVADFVAAL